MTTARKLETNSAEELQTLREELKALHRVQAVIEFNLDGSILMANENFLKAVGYSIGEIQNQHHSMFCDPDYTHTIEYKKFWQTLAQGDFVAGEFKRFGKGGREIWINASYNPIFDTDGKPCKLWVMLCLKFRASTIVCSVMGILRAQGSMPTSGRSSIVVNSTLVAICVLVLADARFGFRRPTIQLWI